MSDVNVVESAENLSDAIDPPITVKLGGKPYKLSPLTPFDFAEAERSYIVDNLNSFLEQTRIVKGIFLPDSTRGLAIAEIMSRTIGLDEVIETFRGRLHLVYLSLKKLTPGITLESMASIDAMDLNTLSQIVYHITGIVARKEEDSKDPLGMTEKTSTPEGSAPTSPTGGDTFQG